MPTVTPDTQVKLSELQLGILHEMLKPVGDLTSRKQLGAKFQAADDSGEPDHRLADSIWGLMEQKLVQEDAELHEHFSLTLLGRRVVKANPLVKGKKTTARAGGQRTAAANLDGDEAEELGGAPADPDGTDGADEKEEASTPPPRTACSTAARNTKVVDKPKVVKDTAAPKDGVNNDAASKGAAKK